MTHSLSDCVVVEKRGLSGEDGARVPRARSGARRAEPAVVT